MALAERLRQVAIALIRHDDGGACLGNQEIRAGDPDIRLEVALPQNLPRLV